MPNSSIPPETGLITKVLAPFGVALSAIFTMKMKQIAKTPQKLSKFETDVAMTYATKKDVQNIHDEVSHTRKRVDQIFDHLLEKK